MQPSVVRSAFALLAFAILSCAEAPTGPVTRPAPALSLSTAVSYPQLVISQVYGGGGNSGATYTHDFVELFNPGTVAIDVSGWRVLYTSATGTSWSATTLSGSVQPGGYYLVQQAKGAGGTMPLPAPDATGGLTMGASAGKVALIGPTGTVSGSCPSGLVDLVSFGTTATNCGAGTTPAPGNTLATIRNEAGCAYTGALGTDFSAAAPTPRNSASPVNVCGGTPPEPPVVASISVTPAEATAVVGAAQAFAAAAHDAEGNPVASTFVWSSSDAAIASVDGNGLVTAAAAGAATIVATAPNGVTGSASFVVTAAPPAAVVPDVVISQVYGGGGNGGAAYSHDFIELFNRGSTAVDVTGWMVHYGSASSSSAGGSSSNTIASGTIQPGGYFLVQLASNNSTVGAPLPTPDALGSINASGSSGKFVVTMPGITPTGPCPSNQGIVDRVGYGSTNCVTDWGGNTTSLTSTTSLFRNNDGCIRTGATSADFTAGAAQPRNTAAPRKNCVQPPRPASTATLVISELMRDPVNAESMSWGQWFEVHNYGTTPIDLQGWTIISAGSSQPDHVIDSSVVVAPGAYAVLGRGADAARNGGVTLAYNYFRGSSSTMWLDAADFLMLVDGAGARADSVAWTSLPRGVSAALRDATVPHSSVAGPAWGYSTSTYGDGDYGTPGSANVSLTDVPPFVSANRISFSGRTAADAPIPAGFEAQVFATLRDGEGTAIPTEFLFESLTPSVATIDSRGVVRALAAGEGRFRATATDGTTRIHTLVMQTPVASTTAQYGDHDEFGLPFDADAADDFIIRRREYITSWNGSRGIPNWVAYNLNATQVTGGQDRCNCFTFDPELEAAGFPRYTTADYTGAGAFHGYGIDRGHLVRSFDRTAGSLDNARTFYFSNIIPQVAEVNQGPWSLMESYLGSLATNGDREVYIYAGGSGTLGTIKNEGRIVIPANNWKVALVLPRGMGLADVRDYRDVEVIAAVMPNVPGPRNDWQAEYRVTVDSVERLSGYTFMSELPADVQRALKSNTKPPIGLVDGPYTTAEGSALTLSAAGSVDPNGTIVSYEWSFGDGTTATGMAPTHTYALTGSYSIRLVVTDNDGLVDTVTTTAQVARIDPVVGLANLETIVQGLLGGDMAARSTAAGQGGISAGEARSLLAKIEAARRQLEAGNATAFVNQIEALVREVEAMGRSSRLGAATVDGIRFEAERLIRAVVARAA